MAKKNKKKNNTSSVQERRNMRNDVSSVQDSKDMENSAAAVEETEAVPEAPEDGAVTDDASAAAENAEEKQAPDGKKSRLKQSTEEMSENMKQLLSGQLKDLQKHEKRRSAEILGVFAKHNFYANGLTPEELRSTLEDLGPTYVKIGQIMSSRVDLLPESYCKELEKLRQNVQELDPALARAVIEQETGKKIDEIYQEFRDKPIGSASIGQAHYAVLKDGTPVVTKVQRPLIADMMRKGPDGDDYII